MGLFTNLLLLPVTGPYRGLRFLLESIQEQANAEFFDPGRIQADLMALGLRYDLGEMTDDEYLDAETALLERLNQARANREEPGDGYVDGYVDGYEAVDGFEDEADTGTEVDVRDAAMGLAAETRADAELDATGR